AAAEAEICAIWKDANLARMHVAAQVKFKNQPEVFRLKLKPRIIRGRRFEKFKPGDFKWTAPLPELAPESDFELLKDTTGLNPVSAGTLKEFLEWGRAKCPAKRYLIQFWGHAFGPMGLFLDQDHRPLGLDQVRKALDALGQPADIVLFRNCFMDTLETA